MTIAGVLAHRQDAAGRDVRVLEQVEGHESVVRRGLRVVEDRAELAQVGRPKQVRDVPHGLAGERRQRGRLDLEELSPAGGEGADAVRREEAVLGVVLTEREQVGVGEFGHSVSSRVLRICVHCRSGARRVAASRPRL
jgi:hypothetical protein